MPSPIKLTKKLTAVASLSFWFSLNVFGLEKGTQDSSKLREMVSMNLWFTGHEKPFSKDPSQWFVTEAQQDRSLNGEGPISEMKSLPNHVLYEILILEREMVYEKGRD